MGIRARGCCCMRLRTAGLAHGWVFVIVLMILILITSKRIVFWDPNYSPPRNAISNAPQTLNDQLISLVIYIIDLVVAGLLVSGISNNKPKLLLPWLVLKAIGTVIMIAVVMLYALEASRLEGRIAMAMAVAATVGVLVIGLSMWSWVVIYSLYQEIRDVVNKPTVQQVVFPNIESPPYEEEAPPYETLDRKNIY